MDIPSNHILISNYLNNNNFINTSNFNNILNTQLFYVSISNPQYKINVQDVIGFKSPALRFDSVSQNLFNTNTNIITGKSYEPFTLRLIENSDMSYRSSFYTLAHSNFNKSQNYMNNFPDSYTFNLRLRVIKTVYDEKNRINYYNFSKILLFENCVVTDLNDIDYDVSKMNYSISEITCKYEDYKVIPVIDDKKNTNEER